MPKALNIPRNTLLEFYIHSRLGSYEIARKLGCSQSLVIKKLKKYDIPTRSVQEAKALIKPRYPRRNFSGNFSEKAYMIGFRIGDLHISKTHPNSPTIRISTNTTKIAQLKVVKTLFKPYGYVRVYPKDKNGARSIRCYVNNSFFFLLPKSDRVNQWILKKKRAFLAFVAGYADAEGTFCVCGGAGLFSIKSQDKNILHSLWKHFNRYGIQCKRPFLSRRAGTIDKRGIKNNKDVWQLTVYRKDSLLSLIKKVGPLLKHSQKIKEMRFVKKNIEERKRKFGDRKDNRWYKTYAV